MPTPRTRFAPLALLAVLVAVGCSAPTENELSLRTGARPGDGGAGAVNGGTAPDPSSPTSPGDPTAPNAPATTGDASTEPPSTVDAGAPVPNAPPLAACANGLSLDHLQKWLAS